LSQKHDVHSVVFPAYSIHGNGSHQTVEHIGEGITDVRDCHSFLAVLEGEDFDRVAFE
jgi:hypothetical protein